MRQASMLKIKQKSVQDSFRAHNLLSAMHVLLMATSQPNILANISAFADVLAFLLRAASTAFALACTGHRSAVNWSSCALIASIVVTVCSIVLVYDQADVLHPGPCEHLALLLDKTKNQ